MAYTKNTWASGDVVTSAKLNNIENGIASGGVLVVNAALNNEELYELDKTYTDIVASPECIVYVPDSLNPNFIYRGRIICTSEFGGVYSVILDKASLSATDPLGFAANSPTGTLVETEID